MYILGFISTSFIFMLCIIVFINYVILTTFINYFPLSCVEYISICTSLELFNFTATLSFGYFYTFMSLTYYFPNTFPQTCKTQIKFSNKSPSLNSKLRIHFFSHSMIFHILSQTWLLLHNFLRYPNLNSISPSINDLINLPLISSLLFFYFFPPSLFCCYVAMEEK